MGLDFSHGNGVHWSCTGFHAFRVKLAAEAGIALNCMESYAFGNASGTKYDLLKLIGVGGGDDEKREEYIALQPVITWDTVYDDVKPLLNHSDCDGELTPDECRKVAPRLRELVNAWSNDDRDKRMALRLADAMEQAAAANENLEFRWL